MIQGIFASNNGIVGDRVGDFSSVVLRMNPTGTSLLLALSSGMNKAGAGDTVFTWYEDSHQSGRTNIVAADGAGLGPNITVGDGSFYVPGAIALVEETGEHVLVMTVAGNILTVARSLGGTPNVALTNAMNLQQIGNAHEEASGMPVALTQQGAPRLNYTQIFRNSWAISGTAKAVTYRTGSKLAQNKRDCATFHAEDMERSFMWGRKHIGTLNGKQFRTTDGVVSQIETFGGTVQSAATGGVPGEFSLTDFEGFIRQVFAINVKGQPNERIALGGDQVLHVLNQQVKMDSNYNLSAGESKVGIMVTTIQTPFGSLKLMTHPLMNENPMWSKELYVMHPGGIRKRVLRETNEEGYDANGKRIQGKDADEGVITTEAGIEVGAARTMGILRNVNKAVKSNP